MSDTIYYKIYYMKNKGYVTIVCLQDFDECDYRASNFLTNKFGDHLIFFDELDAIKWLNTNIKPDKIDFKYKDKDDRNFVDFYKED